MKTMTAVLTGFVLLGCSATLFGEEEPKWDKHWKCDGLTLYKVEILKGLRLDLEKELEKNEVDELTEDQLEALNALKNLGIGKVVSDSLDISIDTFYTVDGLDLRWDWEGGETNYSVVLGQGISGLVARYYDFSMADKDGMAKPQAVFLNCY